MRIAGTPKTIEAPRQPTAAMIGAPMTATTTVPTLPPAMWALIAKPRRSGGNCSARRPLPTGCWGEPPIRDRHVGHGEGRRTQVAAAWATKPPPNRRPPAPSSRRRETRRVSDAKLSWTAPDANAPTAARNAIVSTLTP